MIPDPDYRPLTPADVDEAARVIAAAFVDDPLCAYVLPIRRTRISALTKFFRAMGRLNIRAGSAFGVSDPLEGVSIWSFPGKSSASASLKDLIGFLPVLFSQYTIGIRRARPRRRPARRGR